MDLPNYKMANSVTKISGDDFPNPLLTRREVGAVSASRGKGYVLRDRALMD